MMIFINHLSKQLVRPKSVVEKFVLILSPFAPHIAEELWQRLGHSNSLAYENWPEYNKELIKEKEVELAVQVNGKIKDRIVVSMDADEEKIKQLKKGIIPIYEPGLEAYVLRNYQQGRLVFTTDMKMTVEKSDVIFIAVGTPPDEDGSADLSYVLAVATSVGQLMKSSKIVVNMIFFSKQFSLLDIYI